MYYLTDGPERAFVSEELMMVPEDTQLPPDFVKKKNWWLSIWENIYNKSKQKKMSLVLFDNLSEIETLFDNDKQPWFKRADVGRYLGIVNVKNMNISCS